MQTKTGMSTYTKLVLGVVVCFLLILGCFFAYGLGRGPDKVCVQEAGASGAFTCNNLEAFVNIGGDNTVITESPGSGNSTIEIDIRKTIGSYLVEGGSQQFARENTGNPIIDWMNRTKLTYVGLGALGTIWVGLFLLWWLGRREGRKRYNAYVNAGGSGYDDHIADLKAGQRNL